jgi:hypothetical protein
MNRRTRQALAVAMLATALCADRAAAGLPQLRPQVTEMARQFVDRLTRGFRRSVRSMPIAQSRGEGRFARIVAPLVTWVRVIVHPSSAGPFRFRLPPPLG